ncbi:MAG TPA: hypothetical protein VK911_12155 [Vicinamibacterales bacterium]|nr:hypothetical protein [Vicinamibacterales bacterium]
MPHPLVLAVFREASLAAAAARRLRHAGFDQADLSIVARSHDDEGRLAEALGATPGVELEDSRTASFLGELWGQAVAAIATVLPGIGGVASAGPLSAEFGEAVGHAAGRIASVLEGAGVPVELAEAWQERIREGALLLGAHVREGDPEQARRICLEAGADEVALARWE